MDTFEALHSSNKGARAYDAGRAAAGAMRGFAKPTEERTGRLAPFKNVAERFSNAFKEGKQSLENVRGDRQAYQRMPGTASEMRQTYAAQRLDASVLGDTTASAASVVSAQERSKAADANLSRMSGERSRDAARLAETFKGRFVALEAQVKDLRERAKEFDQSIATAEKERKAEEQTLRELQGGA